MPRLVINPGTPSTWEIQLRPGNNLLGRGFANDFKIDHPSVSGSHCQIVVENGNVVLKDLGSTNGTFVNRAPVSETYLQPGQIVHLGGVEMVYGGRSANDDGDGNGNAGGAAHAPADHGDLARPAHRGGNGHELRPLQISSAHGRPLSVQKMPAIFLRIVRGNEDSPWTAKEILPSMWRRIGLGAGPGAAQYREGLLCAVAERLCLSIQRGWRLCHDPRGDHFHADRPDVPGSCCC